MTSPGSRRGWCRLTGSATDLPSALISLVKVSACSAWRRHIRHSRSSLWSVRYCWRCLHCPWRDAALLACTDVTAAIAPPAMRETVELHGSLLLIQVFAVAITFKPESGSNLHEKRCPEFGCHDAALVSPRHGDGTLPVLPQSRPWNASLRWGIHDRAAQAFNPSHPRSSG